MPGRIASSSSRPSSRDSYDGSPTRKSAVPEYDEYPAVSFPGYAEQPLDKQLEPIAVVGMGCHLPGEVRSPAGFWDMMMNKRTGQTPKVPADRFNIDAHFHDNNDRPGSFGVLGGYFLKDDLSNFDPGLFGITPIEAMWMDPQQRKLLEVVYEALESGGIPLEKISGTRTGVFAASFTADWQQMAFKEHSFRHNLAATGVDPGIISNRISHVFNLNGPSILCNTACSSSMYALHNACNALRNREADAAIVAGVNLIITVDQHMNTAKLGVLSPTSTCHTFDASADGYGRADAAGAVYLKPLSDAIRDGDPIRGVIRSSAVNSNGKVPGAGITHPNREGQADVIAHAYERGGDLDPRLTGYFECHGTGTAVGDPLEVHAVSIAMNKNRQPGEEPLLIGAVKTNIGHSEAASGLSALIKAILTVERGVIPPVRGLVNPSPAIKWDEWKVQAPTEAVPFPAHLPVRRVSINSFGYGGTNAHAIVENADSLLRNMPRQQYRFRDDNTNSGQKSAMPRRAAHRRRPFLLPFSAHDKPTLLRNLDAHAKVVSQYNLLDLSYTLSNRRSVLLNKGFTVASHETLDDAFSNVAASFTFADGKKRGPKPPTVGFVFTGQGAQWARMGAELLDPVLFNQAVQTILTAEEFSDVDLFIEVGPHSAMSGPIKQIKAALGREKLEYIPTLLRGTDSAVQLLKVAGEMFLRAYPLEMDQVSTAYVESGNKLAPAPAVIVDLPPYQWNYARPFWAESRASREHRLRTHPRHDVLGERTLGGSPANPTWRNMLRLRDLPWLGDHALGGEVKALVVPDGDDGIEVLLGLSASMYGSGWWDFTVSSIDDEGVKKEHMAASPSVPAARPGTRPCFQASCTTAVKQSVDASLGESRYVLHPATVDSVLQLSITAIYAGRTTAINYGVIPIQLDEVTIWPPTEEQVQTSTASAYAWVDKRGVRSFESSAQMQAADKSLLLEIVNLRGVSYEAAVPQKAPSALTERLYGELSWDVDFDALVESADLKGFTVPEAVHLALFKRPETKVLQVGASDIEGVKQILTKSPRASYTVTVASDDELESVKTALKDYPRAKVVKLDLTQELSAQSLAAGAFNVLVVRQAVSEEELTKLRETVKIGGYVLSDTSSGTAKAAKVSEEAQDTKEGAQHTVQLVYGTAQTAIVSSVWAVLQALGWTVEVTALKDLTDGKILSHVIILADFESPLLFNITDEEFSRVQAITNTTSSLLWVTPGGLLEGKRPEFGMVHGLARTISSEQASLDFRTVDIDQDTVTSEDTVSAIVRVAKQQATPTGEKSDREFCVANGKTYISRLVGSDSLNNSFSATRAPEPTAFTSESRISGAIVKGRVIFHQEAVVEDVKPGHVEVRVEASGLTKEGVLVISGTDYPTTFSHEIGGIVTRVGAGVTTHKAGDKVVGFHADNALSAYASALHGLETLGQIKANDNVLVLHGTGLTGVAAVKVALTKGAVPYVVVETPAEAEFFQTQLGLDAEQTLFAGASEDAEAAASVLLDILNELTAGHGADIVFSAGNTDQATAREAWRHIAPLGRFLDAGRKDVLHRRALDSVPTAQRGASYLSFDLVGLFDARPEVLARLLPTIVGLVQQGVVVAPGPVQTVHLSELDKAVAGFSDAFGAVKSVVTYEADAEKTVAVVPARPPLRFNPDSSYLLVGCLGGLGRSLTSWMMESGARRFTFLSRSGADSPSAAKLVEDMEKAGAVVQVVRGDATSKEDVVRAVAQVPAEHPIRGVVHAAMVLRDGLFHSMTYNNWKTSVSPKILGAANLHAVLADEPLDFFLMTSSVSGVLGNTTQSNYAAANTYLDTLARQRRVAGKPATSVVLPMVLGVGVVAENVELEQSLKRKGMYGIDEEELLGAFEAAITSRGIDTAIDHIVVGLDPAKLQKAVRDELATDSFWVEDARFSHAVHDMNASAEDGSDGEGGQAQSIISVIKAAASPAEAVGAVTEHFVGKLARMLLLDLDEFEPDVKSIASYGIDSMIGAELRNWIFKEYKLDVPFQQLLGETLTITKFAIQVVWVNSAPTNPTDPFQSPRIGVSACRELTWRARLVDSPRFVGIDSLQPGKLSSPSGHHQESTPNLTMAPSQSTALQLAAHAFATIFVGFGINAILRPEHALTFFEFSPPSSPQDAKMVDSLMAVYGARDIFMGLAIYSAALFGTNKSLGWTLIAASGVAAADGAVCYLHGQGEWNHWGYAPMITVVGVVLLGLFDGAGKPATKKE
ncbi:hypothetical protein F5144DRAFT_616611 [Chaetomium tenue]|uniref:Uncharacterized protein n=1 Tax=Chaetomium tenue TaxID=1854479 RepID=A0ACB7PM89_9PEZI|nr:hypothetical protein F5144DRAFT_616611 [Chaetomium globosum]